MNKDNLVHWECAILFIFDEIPQIEFWVKWLFWWIFYQQMHLWKWMWGAEWHTPDEQGVR